MGDNPDLIPEKGQGGGGLLRVTGPFSWVIEDINLSGEKRRGAFGGRGMRKVSFIVERK